MKTQRECAKELRITHQHLNAVIRGRIRPSLKLALRIEDLMGVPIGEMIPELADKKSKENITTNATGGIHG